MFSTTYALTIHHLRQRQRQTEREKEQLSSELAGLKSQVNPHFLFNTLNNLYTLAYLNEPSTAPMILKLSELMRYMLYECRDDKTPLENEVRFLNNLVAMQQLKSDTFAQNLRLTVEGVAPHHRIAPLLLLVFLENSFKHSDLNQNPSGYIHIAVQAGADDQLQFHCVNTKRSLTGQSTEPGGIGLVNVRKRLALIYPDRHTLLLDDQPDRFAVHLMLPLT
ncbi:sensor histidine kinase [Spirosoma radiotolerans]|uniref:sensor histidine kinase n=1 Tax=Spirosoma radiotolerans TaxID=1379870 RepID=UPI0006967374|nr:histidine kinase [Spirosoma radiotolerans]